LEIESGRTGSYSGELALEEGMVLSEDCNMNYLVVKTRYGSGSSNSYTAQ